MIIGRAVFRGTQEQLIAALRFSSNNESSTDRAIKEAAATEIERLQEYEWMYQGLSK